jgi:type IV secretory pathway VirJ component
MRRFGWIASLIVLIAAGSAQQVAAAPPAPAAKPAAGALPAVEYLDHGDFTHVAVYRPDGTPKRFVFLLSGETGWDPAMTTLAQTLTAQGALVAGVDTPKLFAGFDADEGQCTYAGGDFENLSHFIQAYEHLPTYLLPVIAGYSSGATTAYAVAAQSPKDTFLGAATIGFVPGVDLRHPFCKGPGGLETSLRPFRRGYLLAPATALPIAWVTLQGENDVVASPKSLADFVTQVPGARLVPMPGLGHRLLVPEAWASQFASAVAGLDGSSTTARVAPPAALEGLPLVEVPPTAPAPGGDAGDEFAVLLSGDGGWAGLDKEVAGALAAQGIPVVGVDSLRYFWTPRTPAGAGADIDRLLRYYLVHWNKKRALLIGYSQGADVLPFIINHLSPATREHVALGAVMGLSEHALFEFHVSSWVSDSDSGPPTLPEMEKISEIPMLCIYGQGEDDTLCPKLNPNKVKVVELPGGHHFGGDYEKLADAILAAARPPPGGAASSAR